MATKKMTGKQVEKEMKDLRKQEEKMLKQWNPEIAMVTFVGIILIVGLSVFSGYMISGLQSQINSLSQQVSLQPCASSTDSKICGVNSKLTVQMKPVLSCGNAQCSATPGKVKITVFHSPTCPYCEAQVTVLEQIKNKYGDKVEITYACKAIHSGDEQLCRSSTKYLPYDESVALAKSFGVEGEGTPIAVFNCKYSRVGSLALEDTTPGNDGKTGTTFELADLTKIIDALSA
jgi:thiol-disulfide isomerase/thioredoxin